MRIFASRNARTQQDTVAEQAQEQKLQDLIDAQSAAATRGQAEYDSPERARERAARTWLRESELRSAALERDRARFRALTECVTCGGPAAVLWTANAGTPRAQTHLLCAVHAQAVEVAAIAAGTRINRS